GAEVEIRRTNGFRQGERHGEGGVDFLTSPRSLSAEARLRAKADAGRGRSRRLRVRGLSTIRVFVVKAPHPASPRKNGGGEERKSSYHAHRNHRLRQTLPRLPLGYST